MSKNEFKQGDKVKTAGGLAGVIRQLNTSGSAALVDTGENEHFDSSWYSTDSLKKGSSRPPAAKPAPVSGEDGEDKLPPVESGQGDN